MASTVTKENLDERIERIRKRNEELEKKHREAEEDRLMALKDNAMVEIKPPKDEDWPKGHKYDKIDFTYDVKPEKLEEMKQQQQKKQTEEKTKRDYKKFPDGEGPPPDPAYNFLADAERDGILTSKADNRNDKKDFRQNNKNKDGNNKRNTINNNSFRGRGGKNHSNIKYQKQNSQPEYEQWRSEREKIDEARINRQKIGDGKWRREWDNDKVNAENESLLRPERTTLGDAINSVKKSPTHSAKHHNNTHQYSGHNMNNNDCMFERRGNITVSVSQTGEVKSVKLTSAPAIGTGRVGPRQVSKPQFSVQTIEKEIATVQQVPISSKPHNKEHHQKSIAQQQQQQQPHHKTTQNCNQNTQHKSSNNINIINNQKIQQTKNSVHVNNITPSIQPAAAVPTAITCPPSPIKNKRKLQNATSKFVANPNGIGIPVVEPSLTTVANPFVAEVPIAGGSANGIVPKDLSHKPEFAKKSVQDRLLRVRQQTGDVQKISTDQQQQQQQQEHQQQEKDKDPQEQKQQQQEHQQQEKDKDPQEQQQQQQELQQEEKDKEQQQQQQPEEQKQLQLQQLEEEQSVSQQKEQSQDQENHPQPDPKAEQIQQQLEEQQSDLNPSLENKEEQRTEDLLVQCDNKTNDSIKSIEPIAACN